MKDFRNFIQEEEKKHTGIKPDATDLIRISDANHYFNKYKTEQLILSGVGNSTSLKEILIDFGNVIKNSKGQELELLADAYIVYDRIKDD